MKWAAVEEALDIVLPADYKRLVQTYGGGLFAGVLWLLEPGCSDAMYDLVAQTAEREAILTELWEAGEDKPSVLHEVNARRCWP
ncbi:SMI1/KNR4 family protein [Streptomyces sp. NPDC088135]|uniref:SMI1/KNR4 family protein n=1 Tax=Streptomyces sp. NPDC088135 TaxID=3160993 RepID=UPI00343D808F